METLVAVAVVIAIGTLPHITPRITDLTMAQVMAERATMAEAVVAVGILVITAEKAERAMKMALVVALARAVVAQRGYYFRDEVAETAVIHTARYFIRRGKWQF